MVILNRFYQSNLNVEFKITIMIIINYFTHIAVLFKSKRSIAE